MEKKDYASLSNISILYIEDDEITRKHISQLLERRAKSLYIARHGFSGAEIFKDRSDEIDVIISDIRMPLMDGNEMIEKIKEVRDDVKIVVITAYPDDMNKDVDAILKKPVDKDELFEAILKVAPKHLIRD